jgi:F0F1-type ATP synthase membrane subunit a
LNSFLPSGVPAIAALLVVPIELIALVLRIVSLAVRVFANMTAGHVLMKMLAGFL